MSSVENIIMNETNENMYTNNIIEIQHPDQHYFMYSNVVPCLHEIVQSLDPNQGISVVSTKYNIAVRKALVEFAELLK